MPLATSLLAPLLLFAAALPSASGLAARTWLSGAKGGKPLELGLLPFGMDEALLPGETKQERAWNGTDRRPVMRGSFSSHRA